MNINTKNLSFVNFNNEEMQWVKFNGVTVYEAWKDLIASGIPPLTLTKCKSADLIDYEIYGNSEQGKILFDKTQIITNLCPSTTFKSDDKWRGFTFQCKPNVTYRLSKIKGATLIIVSSTDYPAEGVAINSEYPNHTGTAMGITTTENDKYLTFFFYRTNVDTVNYNDVLNSIDIRQINLALETPIEIESVGEKTNNLYNINNLYIPVKAGEIYQVEFFSEAYRTISLYDENKTLLKHIVRYAYKGAYNKWIVKPQQDGYLVAYTNASYDVPDLTVNLMITKGLTVTLTVTETTNLESNQYIRVNNSLVFPIYEPGYKIPVKVSNDREEIIADIYLKEPLRKIGDYADYIDFENKKVIRNIYNEFLTTVTAKSGVTGAYSIFLTNISKKPKIKIETSGMTIGYAISNKFEYNDTGYTNMVSYPNRIQAYITTGGINRVAYTFDDETIKTVEKAQEKIGNGFDVCYVLETPTEETIELPNIPTLKGTNIIEIDTKIQPSNMEVIYKGKN